jgi:hypothetical protein
MALYINGLLIIHIIFLSDIRAKVGFIPISSGKTLIYPTDLNGIYLQAD